MSESWSVIKDGFETFWSHNKPLFQQMIDEGNRFYHGNGKAHFVDAKGGYVDYPKGYITGPQYDDNGSGKPYYASVKVDGGWAQRSSANRQEVVDWAFAKGREVLAE